MIDKRKISDSLARMRDVDFNPQKWTSLAKELQADGYSLRDIFIEFRRAVDDEILQLAVSDPDKCKARTELDIIEREPEAPDPLRPVVVGVGWGDDVKPLPPPDNNIYPEAVMYGGQLTTYYDAVFRSIAAAEREMSPAPATVEAKPTFADYLHHDNKPALMWELHTLIHRGTKAKNIAIVISALQSLSLLAGYDTKKELYEAMRKEFEFTCTDKGINDFLNSNLSKITPKDIEPIKDIIRAV